MAAVLAKRSKAKRYKVAALLVRDERIVSDGYNGTPSGFDNRCETEKDGALVTLPYVLHAEANALMKLSRSSESASGATLYVLISPCLECAKLIIQARIKRVVFRDEYRLRDGLELLSRAGVAYERVSD